MAVDFSMYSGDSRTITIQISDENGDAVDISTATAVSYGIFKSSGISVLEKELDDGLEAAGSVVTITLEPEDTEDIPAGNYVHECQITLADATVATVLQGQIAILQDYLA